MVRLSVPSIPSLPASLPSNFPLGGISSRKSSSSGGSPKKPKAKPSMPSLPSLPSLPSVSLPSISLPSVSLPTLPNLPGLSSLNALAHMTLLPKPDEYAPLPDRDHPDDPFADRYDIAASVTETSTGSSSTGSESSEYRPSYNDYVPAPPSFTDTNPAYNGDTVLYIPKRWFGADRMSSVKRRASISAAEFAERVEAAIERLPIRERRG